MWDRNAWAYVSRPNFYGGRHFAQKAKFYPSSPERFDGKISIFIQTCHGVPVLLHQVQIPTVIFITILLLVVFLRISGKKKICQIRTFLRQNGQGLILSRLLNHIGFKVFANFDCAAPADFFFHIPSSPISIEKKKEPLLYHPW